MTRTPALFLWCLLLLAPAVHAQGVRAWLDRSHIAVDETATLNIEVTGAASGTPEYAPLLADFRLSGHSSTRSFQQSNGRSEVRTLYGVALQPRREGRLRVPPLQVAGMQTPALELTVSAVAAPPTQAGDLVFIEAEADAATPYVQQAVGYVVRLYVGVPLVSGQLDQAEPEGATLQRVGEDIRYSRELAGRRYTVIERHYLLIPERSGPLDVPGARFRGRGVAGFFEEFLGGGSDALRATGATRTMHVRPIPQGAPQPWLPLRGAGLRWASSPPQVRVGAAATVTLEFSADGATAAQLPAIELPPVDGAQVFADPVQVDERFADGRPQATARRSFSIVPDRAGPLRIEAPRLAWWDAGAGVARSATVPALTLEVMPGVAGPSAPGARPATSPVDSARGLRIPGVQDPVRPWALATVLFALAWLLTLAWGLHRRPRAARDAAPGKKVAAIAVVPALPGLHRALRGGDLADIADALCACAAPPAPGLDAVHAALADPAQRDAVAQLQRARWSDGDPATARQSLRVAFKDGPRWRPSSAPRRDALPPLYP